MSTDGRREVRPMANEVEKREIGVRLRQARDEAGLLQKDLAEKLGVSERSISAYEQGEVVPFRHMRDLEKILDRPVEWFLRGEIPAEPTQLALEEIRGELQEIKLILRGLAAQLDQRSDVRWMGVSE